MGGLRRSEAVELKWRDVTDAREEGGLHEARTAHGRIISGIVNRSRPASSTPTSGRLGLCAEPEEGVVRDPVLVSVVGLALPLAVAVEPLRRVKRRDEPAAAGLFT